MKILKENYDISGCSEGTICSHDVHKSLRGLSPIGNSS
jgi:hypothetical protein